MPFIPIIMAIAGTTLMAKGAVDTLAPAKVSEASTNVAGATTAATTVDASAESSARVNQIGRAALIETSSQGVQGTENSGRYRLLGNSPGLGN
jgi:hypothetical protein